MKTFLGIALLFFIGVDVARTQSCHLRELDLCAATLLLFNQSPTGVATSESDLNRQCSYIHEAHECFRNFTTRCLTPLQREVLNFVSEGSEKLLEEYCTPGTEIRANYLQHAPCLQDAHSQQRPCMTDLQAATEVIGNADFDKRIPITCCAYQRYMQCARTTVEEHCGGEAVEFMQLLLKMAASSLPNIICSGYSSSNTECTTLLPAAGAEPEGSKSESVLSRLFAAYLGN
ncbi:hypothetical protein LAZ67_8003688 [Cordylochernes scorpioides]|uniref:Uncharacterized protein n=1 Tax=Cordylochernes scorpioides TaxID=51811 RepID=A0ABY6KRT0_9ARAC|nr:hypothetical protein LAZ67_8003688 [Cordylochernes scorpioides]